MAVTYIFLASSTSLLLTSSPTAHLEEVILEVVSMLTNTLGAPLHAVTTTTLQSDLYFMSYTVIETT